MCVPYVNIKIKTGDEIEHVQTRIQTHVSKPGKKLTPVRANHLRPGIPHPVATCIQGTIICTTYRVGSVPAADD